VGFVLHKVELEQVLSEYFGFPCQFSFQRLLRTSSSTSGAGTIGRVVADVPSGLSLTLSQETKKRKLLYMSTPNNMKNGNPEGHGYTKRQHCIILWIICNREIYEVKFKKTAYKADECHFVAFITTELQN
jgi:hypothetical protein